MRIQVGINQAEALRLGIDIKKSTHVFNINPKDLEQPMREAIADRLVGGFNLVQRAHKEAFKATQSTNYLIMLTEPTDAALFAGVKADIENWAQVQNALIAENRLNVDLLHLEEFLLEQSLKAKNVALAGGLDGVGAGEYAASLLLDTALRKTLFQDWPEVLKPAEVKKTPRFDWELLNSEEKPYFHIFLQDAISTPTVDTVGFVIYQPLAPFNVGTETESTGLNPSDHEYLDSLCDTIKSYMPEDTFITYKTVFGLFEGDNSTLRFELLIQWTATLSMGSAQISVSNYSSMLQLNPWYYCKRSSVQPGTPEAFAGVFAATYETLTSLAGAAGDYERRELLMGNIEPIWKCIVEMRKPTPVQVKVLEDLEQKVGEGHLARVINLDASFLCAYNILDPWARLRDDYVGVNTSYTVRSSNVDWLLVNTLLAAMLPLMGSLKPKRAFQDIATKVGTLHKGYPKHLSEKNAACWELALEILGYGDSF